MSDLGRRVMTVFEDPLYGRTYLDLTYNEEKIDCCGWMDSMPKERRYDVVAYMQGTWLGDSPNAKQRLVQLNTDEFEGKVSLWPDGTARSEGVFLVKKWADESSVKDSVIKSVTQLKNTSLTVPAAPSLKVSGGPADQDKAAFSLRLANGAEMLRMDGRGNFTCMGRTIQDVHGVYAAFVNWLVEAGQLKLKPPTATENKQPCPVCKNVTSMHANWCPNRD